MFRKREKKIFPPGTFIPFPARVAAIIHLCLAFSLLLWIASKPFLEDLFTIKSEKMALELVMKDPLFKEVRNDQRFQIEEKYKTISEKLKLSFLDKISAMYQILFLKTPPFEQAWLLFSLIIPILLLLRIEGAAQACCLLPILVLAYAIDNQSLKESDSSFDQNFFPSEQYITENYLDKPLSNSIIEQREELLNGWKRYLIYEWAHEQPEKDSDLFQKQARKGEFAFQVAHALKKPLKLNLSVNKTPSKEPLALLAIYFIWNCLFAWIAMRYVLKCNKLSV